MNMNCSPSRTRKTSFAITAAVAITALASSAHAQTSLDDFESYADTVALQAKFSAFDDATAALGATSGVGGSKGLDLELNNGGAGFDAFAIYDLSATLDLTNVTSISFQLAKTGGSNETFSVQLKDEFSSDLAFGPPTIAGPGFATYTIDTSAVSGGLSKILFKTNASDFGTTNLTIDNLQYTSVPEPSSYALLGGIMTLGYIMIRRSK
jgi:hypothetical protein